MKTPPHAATSAAYLRVQRNFWYLTAASVLAVGALSQAFRTPSGPLTGLIVAISGLSAVTTLSLAGRILVVAGRRRRAR